MTARVLPFVLVLVAACGNKQEAAPPKATPPETKASATPAQSAEPAPPPEPPKPKGKPFEVYNSCKDVITIGVGPDLAASTSGRRTIAPSASVEVERDSEGNQVIWIMKENNTPLGPNVHVTRGMKRVEIGRSCSTLNAQ
jgi:hypothetical protein